MSVKAKSHYIHCDFPNCDEEAGPFFDMTEEEVREMASNFGWTWVRNEGWYHGDCCPKCSEVRK